MKKIIFTGIVSVLLAFTSRSQGCSDAGFCTIGNLATHKADTADSLKSGFKLSLPLGLGDEDVFVFAPALEYSYGLSQKLTLQGKLTANYASGNLGSAVGLGDLFVSGTYAFAPETKWKPSLTIGVKLPLSQSDLKEGARSLPMQYQSSLGTVDLITGFALASSKWQFAAGWQQPLSGINRNHFLPVYWDKAEATKYPSSNDFKRKGDVLLRTAYLFSAGSNWSLNGGLLGIYHLGEDSYIDANTSSKPIAIRGSDGLTLNATGGLAYAVSKKVSIGFSGGVPLIVRDVRPDGLTRRFVFSPDILLKF